jgi:O-antigen/teichoic acid export membrane protein
LFWFAVAGPFTLFLWLMRRASYAQMNPRRAAQAGLGYLVIVMASLAVIHGLGVLSLGVVLVMMGACSLAAALWLAAGHVRFGRLPDHLLREVGADHWRYGTWAAATQLLSFIPGNLYYFLLPKMATLEQSGALRALTNLVNPFIQANAAMCLLLLPTFVRSKGTPEGKRVHRLALLGLAGGPLLYWLFLGLFNHQVIHLIYRDKYQQYAGLLWIIALQPVILGMSGTYGSLLRAHQKLNAIFWSGVVAAATAVSLGIEMTLKFGMAGVCWSIVITFTVHHIALWLFSRNVHWKGRQAPPAMEELEAA